MGDFYLEIQLKFVETKMKAKNKKDAIRKTKEKFGKKYNIRLINRDIKKIVKI